MTARPTHSLVTWRYREPVEMANGKRAALDRARELAESTNDSLEVWRLERGLRREKLAVVHPANTVARVVLVGCSKQKRTEKTAAMWLYTSPLFKKQAEYAMKLVPRARVFIVSAKHCLVPLDKKIRPYNDRLDGRTTEWRRAWAEQVTSDLADRMMDMHESGREPLRALDVVLLMGASYARPLRAAAPDDWTFAEPLAGMQVGQRLQWLNRAIARAKKGLPK